MKSYSGIVEAASSARNIAASFDYVVRGRRCHTHCGKHLLAHRAEVIAATQERIRHGTLAVERYREFEVVERGKKRRIQSIPLVDRIGMNAVMQEVERRVLPSFIADTASSIKGRGTLYLHRRLLSALAERPTLKWFYKCDIRKYYESIDQDMMVAMVHRRFREQQVVSILTSCIRLMPTGLSIGLRSSQVLGNMLLSEAVDHTIKDTLGWPWYWRYCDDMVVGAERPEDLTPIIAAIHERTQAFGLAIKADEQVFSIDDRGLDFLGYVVSGDGRVSLRKRVKKRFARCWGRVQSTRRKTELAGSFYGMAKHAHCRHLFETITGYNMRDFAELGIKYVSQDGKKLFECPTVTLGELQGTTIAVLDFETDVKTSQGDGRYVVHVRDEDGQEKKFFTASTEMKQILAQVRDMGELPFRTTIRRKPIGRGKYKYSFT